MSFLHAQSGAETLVVVRREHEVAIVLLNVVQETSDTGLRLISVMRDELLRSSAPIPAASATTPTIPYRPPTRPATACMRWAATRCTAIRWPARCLPTTCPPGSMRSGPSQTKPPLRVE